MVAADASLPACQLHFHFYFSPLFLGHFKSAPTKTISGRRSEGENRAPAPVIASLGADFWRLVADSRRSSTPFVSEVIEQK